VSGTLKLDLAQFRELEAFATFGSELDKVSAAQLDRGYRLTELLKQNLNSPMPVEEQVVSIFAGTKGYLDGIPVEDVKRFEHELLDFVKTRHGIVLETIREKGTLPENDGLDDAVKLFAEQFEPTVELVDEPDAEEQSDAETARAGGRAEATLPEVEIDRGVEGE